MQIQAHFITIGKRSPFYNPKAFTLKELLMLAAVILLLGCIVIPCLAKHRRQAKARACMDNLKQIGVSFRTWALDCGDSYPAQVTLNCGGAKERLETGEVFYNFLVMSNEIGSPKILVCPEDAGRLAVATFSVGFSNTNVSYFVGADAQDTFPQMLLTGDRNLQYQGEAIGVGIFVVTTNRTALDWTRAIHTRRGHIGLADGSVQSVNSRQLALAVANQSCASNRLAIP